MAVRISCINKDPRYDPHHAITHVGGVNSDSTRWRLTLAEAINAIETGKHSFYVSVNNDPVRVIVAVSPHGHKFLKTVADGDHPNNLLSLSECGL
jgi:hypothetical protein